MERIPRRVFLVMAGGALAATRASWAAEEVPSLLDHILLGCNDLERGIAFVEERTGVRAAFGGVHPGRGTQNALLSLGERRYLEIIAPDPKQSGVQQFTVISKLSEPRLIGWAAHPGDLSQFATRLRDAGLAFEGPTPGSRKRPDGRLVQWKTLHLKDDFGGLLPFFIEWSGGTVHPSADAPAGCKITRFSYAGPDYDGVGRIIDQMGLDVIAEPSEKSQIRATFAGPKGEFSVTS